MAVNEGLTVFNLVDGVVDEFNDESGTDEAEGSNDNYCGTSDFYANQSPAGGSLAALSAGFSTTTVTEPDTSTAGTNPAIGCGSYGTFTVPNGYSSINVFTWGAGGGGATYSPPSPDTASDGGGGGFATGTLAVTGGQSFTVVVGEGGRGNATNTSGPHPGALGGGGAFGPSSGSLCNPMKAGGGGLGGLFSDTVSTTATCGFQINATAPQAYLIGAGGGGSGYPGAGIPTMPYGNGGAGGGQIGCAGGQVSEQTNRTGNPTQAQCSAGGGGSQTVGGQGGCACGSAGGTGAQFLGGTSGGLAPNAAYSGTGGSGYFGGGGGSYPGGPGAGGGGSSYFGHPQITCGSTEEGAASVGGGTGNPNYVAGTNEGYNASTGEPAPSDINVQKGEDGYVLLTAAGVCASTVSSTIVSEPFTSTSVPTSARIVVFEENVDTPTLNTDIVASISRDGGTTFTNATLSDSGYVTGSSGQRILTGQATISGQPSGQSMRWKLALANNAVKIHGVSLQWA